MTAFGLAERAAVPELAVQTVVDALRDIEEPGIGLDHEPVGIDAVTRKVAEGRAEELGDTATLRGRVDVPQAMP